MTTKFKYSKYANDRKEGTILLILAIVILPLGLINGAFTGDYLSLKWKTTNLVTFLGIVFGVSTFEWLIWKLAGGYKTYYGHLSRYGKGMKKGSKASQKQIIGYVGSTGLSTGPHLDYRLKKSNQFLDPFGTKFKPRSFLSGDRLKAFHKEIENVALFLEKKEKSILTVEQKIIYQEDSISIL